MKNTKHPLDLKGNADVRNYGEYSRNNPLPLSAIENHPFTKEPIQCGDSVRFTAWGKYVIEGIVVSAGIFEDGDNAGKARYCIHPFHKNSKSRVEVHPNQTWWSYDQLSNVEKI